MKLYLSRSVAVLLLAACADRPTSGASLASRPTAESARPVGRGGVNPRQLLVMGVGLGTDSGAARARLGSPDSADSPFFDVMVGDTLVEWWYPAASMTFAGGQLIELRCRGPECRTALGVAVGDSISDIAERYPGGELVLGQPDREDHFYYPYGETDCGLTFELDRGRATSIHLWCDYA